MGRLLAESVGFRFVDLDRRITELSGKTVAQLFAEGGERYFRDLEREALEGLLAEPTAAGRVIALGGGAVTERELRWRLLDETQLVTLTAPVDTLLQRLGGSGERPLLRGNARRNLTHLLEKRRDAYAECHATLSAEGSAATVVAAVTQAMQRASLVMPLGAQSYRVFLGKGASRRLKWVLGRLAPISKLFVVTEPTVAGHWRLRFEALLRDLGQSASFIEVPTGEAGKQLAVLDQVWSSLLQQGCDRRSVILGLGGGAVGDLAAFAASTVLRGVPLVQVPTSLLSMVDSSVGGKTGINREEGKNLVGTFYQPQAVLCDSDYLSTLGDREYRSGFAEVVKAAWLSSEASVAALEHDAVELVKRSPAALERAIRMSVALKIRVVRSDEREAGQRQLLNLGHTLGHAFEVMGGYGKRSHGEAVSLGLCAAAHISDQLKVAEKPQLPRMRALLQAFDLPTDFEELCTDACFEFVLKDKKRIGSEVAFVLMGEPGATEIRRLPIDTLRRLVGA